jgi:hypothetical protein
LSLNRLRDDIHRYVTKWEFLDRLVLDTDTEKNSKWCGNPKFDDEVDTSLLDMPPKKISAELYKQYIQGTVEECLAEGIVNIFTLAKEYNVDLDFHVAAKMNFEKRQAAGMRGD